MSLSVAVLEIADEMEKDANDYKKANADISAGLVLNWSRQLKRIVKASESANPAGPTVADYMQFAQQQPPPRPPVRKHELAEEKYASATGESMTVLHGGVNDGTTVSIDAGAPVGAFVIVDRQYYVKREDQSWNYDEERTKKSLLSTAPSRAA